MYFTFEVISSIWISGAVGAVFLLAIILATPDLVASRNASTFPTALGISGGSLLLVGQQTHELGIRLALGAQPGMVFRLIMREGSIMLFAGLALGLLLAAATGKILSGILFEVGAFDPPAFASAFVVLAAATLLATWLPARRATRINPMVALRTE